MLAGSVPKRGAQFGKGLAMGEMKFSKGSIVKIVGGVGVAVGRVAMVNEAYHDSAIGRFPATWMYRLEVVGSGGSPVTVCVPESDLSWAVICEYCADGARVVSKDSDDLLCVAHAREHHAAPLRECMRPLTVAYVRGLPGHKVA